MTQWALENVCATCLDDPQLAALRNGTIGIATTTKRVPPRCVFCGYELAESTEIPLYKAKSEPL